MRKSIISVRFCQEHVTFKQIMLQEHSRRAICWLLSAQFTGDDIYSVWNQHCRTYFPSQGSPIQQRQQQLLELCRHNVPARLRKSTALMLKRAKHKSQTYKPLLFIMLGRVLCQWAKLKLLVPQSIPLLSIATFT